MIHGETLNVSLCFHFIGLVMIRTKVFIWVVLLTGWPFTITFILIMNLIMLVRLLLSNMWLFRLISPPSHTLSCCYLGVLTDSLSFGHDFKGSHFVIWKMKDFGIQESWIQLLKISYQSFCSSQYLLEFETIEFLPLYLSENGDKLILANDQSGTLFIYKCRDNSGEPIQIPNKVWWLGAKNYVESEFLFLILLVRIYVTSCMLLTCFKILVRWNNRLCEIFVGWPNRFSCLYCWVIIYRPLLEVRL